jgi:TP901 family phage tail tape measure protein
VVPITDRTTKVTLIAQVSQYVSGMEKAAQKTREVGGEAEKLGQKKEAFDILGRSLLAIGTVAGVGVGMAISKFAEFDQAMSYVQAATHETADNMGLLRDAALEAGARTVYSATEAANAIEELSKAGVSTTDILNGGLNGALDLAAAGGLGVAEAAGIAATSLKTFNLEGSDMTHVSDLLAAGAGKAMGDVSDLSSALNQTGLVAKQTGLSIDETTAGLAAFASNGLLGSDAGTSFKSMLQRLTPQSDEAAALMKELNIEAYDAQGNFLGLSEYAGVLRKGLMDLTPEARNAAMATIFGSDAVRAAAVLYDEGSDGIRKWEEAVNDQGYAAETAAMRLDNLAGDTEALGGAFDTALIKTGSNANDVLRLLVQTAGDMIDRYNDMPGPVQAVALGVGVLTAAVGLGGGAFFTAVPKVAAYKVALSELGPVAQRTGRFLGVVGKGLGAAAAVGVAISLLDAWKASAEGAGTSASELANALATARTSKDLLTTAFKDKSFLQYGGDVEKVTKNFGGLIDQVSEAPDMRWLGVIGEGMVALDPEADHLRNQFEALGEELSKMSPGAASSTMKKLIEDYNLTDAQVSKLIDLFPAYKDALTEQATEAGLASDKATLLKLALAGTEEPATEAADSYLAAATEAQELADKVRDLIDAVNASNEVGQDAVSSNADWLESLQNIRDIFEENFIQKQKDDYIAAHGSLEGYTESLKGFNVSLDESTVAGSANAAGLADLAAKAQDAAMKQYVLDKNTMGAKDATDKYVSTLGASRQSIIDQAIANGANADEVQRLMDKLYALPTQREVEVLVDTANATRQINDWVSIQNGKQIHIAVGAGGAGGITKADGGIVDYYAAGGIRENHVAQIAPAGSWRVWGEPETGGEAYIPFAQSKRARSLQIWSETGKRLGVSGFADGGYTPQYATSYMPVAPAAVSVSPEVSLRGATIVLSVDGKQMTGFVQDQIVGASRGREAELARGRRRQ